MEFWKSIEEEVFENYDLDIYEKMCLLVLMSRDESTRMTTGKLAEFMGCGKVTAKRAFDSLRMKGYLAKDYQSDPPVRRESSVIQNPDDVAEITKVLQHFDDDFKEGFFKVDQEPNVDTPENPVPSQTKHRGENDLRRRMAEYLLGDETSYESVPKAFVSQKESKEALVDEVIELIEEKINFKEANIILAFAGNDMERIKKHYVQAKSSQVKDTIGFLINALQKKESNVIKTEEKAQENSQIDTNRLKKMQAYHNNKMK
ncbi:MAG: hypothetical protein IBX70_03825 [Clostridia bacterium]|nr:hypothetical protein [Clostridia bacterium]